MEEGQSRKLAVILHADVVGSTELVRLHETVADQRMQDAFRRFSEEITNHNGVAHEIRGDALVAEFARASDAVMASLAFQDANSSLNETLADDIRPVLRVGIALGEVLVTESRMTGEGVVLAQRLEQLAEPGGVCVQDAAYQTMPKRLPYDYESLGNRELKGFDEPVRAYSVRRRDEALASQREASAPELPEEPSIAVLPFTNMSGDPEQEYFSDGITEDIITALSRISGLLVVARNSTMVYKGESVDVQQVGQELGVHYVLEGSVRKAGNRIRVTAQLIDARTGHHQWADRYDRELDDIFAVQDEIARRITVEMRVELLEGESARIFAGGTKNVKAWELAVRASELVDGIVLEDNLEARRLAGEALKIDPKYVSAWEEVGWTHVLDAAYGWSDSRGQSIERAFEAARKALQFDKDYPDALALLGQVYLLRGEYDQAIEVSEKSVSLAPSHSANVALLGFVLSFAGRGREALRATKRAIRLSPNYPAYYLRYLGIAYLSMNEINLAISTLRKAVAVDPDTISTKIWLTSALVEGGRLEDAKKIAENIMAIEPSYSVEKGVPGRFKDPIRRQNVAKNLVAAGLPE